MKTHIENYLFVLFLMLFSSIPYSFQIDHTLVKKELKKQDEALFKKISDKLEKRRDSLLKLQEKHKNICVKYKDICEKKFDSDTCLKERDSLQLKTELKINQTIAPSLYSEETSCKGMEEAYLKNKKIIDDNILNATAIVYELKALIKNHKRTMFTRQQDKILGMSFLQTGSKKDYKQIKEEKRKLNQKNKEQNEGGFFKNLLSPFKGLPFLHHKTETNNNKQINIPNSLPMILSQIKAKLNSIEDNDQRFKFMQDSIKTFIEILREFEKGRDEIEIAYTKTIKECRKTEDKRNVLITLKPNEADSTFINTQKELLENELYQRKNNICDLKNSTHVVCNEIYDLCLKKEEDLKIELNQVNDLLFYFDKV